MKSMSMLRTRCGGRQNTQMSTRGSTLTPSSPRPALFSSRIHCWFWSMMYCFTRPMLTSRLRSSPYPGVSWICTTCTHSQSPRVPKAVLHACVLRALAHSRSERTLSALSALHSYPRCTQTAMAASHCGAPPRVQRPQGHKVTGTLLHAKPGAVHGACAVVVCSPDTPSARGRHHRPIPPSSGSLWGAS